MGTLDECATLLFEQRLANARIDRLEPPLEPASLTDAYTVQALLVEKLCAHADTAPAGFKIALTSPTARALCGIDHSVFGRMLEADVHGSGETLEVARRGSAIIEVEFGFSLSRDVPVTEEPWTAESIAEFVEAVMPSIEVVDHHYGGLDRMSAAAIIADNAIHGAWYHGPSVIDWRHLDLNAMTTLLEVNGRQVLKGAGNRTMDGPLDALAWLANALPEVGLTLRAGDRVTTGLTTDGIHDASPGEHLRAVFDGLGEVHVECV